MPRIAATVFGHWRSNSAWVSAPRQSVAAPPTPLVQLSTVSGRPSKVLKKLSRFMPATRSVAAHVGCRGGPRVGRLEVDVAAQRVDRPHAVGVAARRVAGPRVGQDADDAGGGVTAAQRVARRQRLAAAPKRIGSGFWACERVVEDDPVAGCWPPGARAPRAPGATTLVGCCEAAARTTARTWPKRPSWKCSVTYIVCGRRTSMPSYRSRNVGRGDREASRRSAATVPGAAVDDRCRREICVWSWFSPAVPVTRTTSPRLTRVRVAALEDEDAVRRGGVAVAVGVLDEEPAQRRATAPS